jgi:hypothetical protein
MEGKRAEWEGVVMVPFIDEQRLLAAVRCGHAPRRALSPARSAACCLPPPPTLGCCSSHPGEPPRCHTTHCTHTPHSPPRRALTPSPACLPRAGPCPPLR